MSAATDASVAEVKRYTKDDVEAMVKNSFKSFCKEKCAECGKPATKSASTMPSFVVANMLGKWWCGDCGRLLCESCRIQGQHKCEKLDQQKDRNKNITREQLAAQIAEAEAYKQSLEEEKKAEARRAAEVEEQKRLERKDRRLLIAKKSKHVEDFLQGLARDTEGAAARGVARRDEMLELYTRAKRIALTLYNEYEHPSLPGLAEEDWQAMKDIYKRAQEITGMYISVEGQPLDMQNPWDPPPPQAEQPAEADGPGFGRGLL